MCLQHNTMDNIMVMAMTLKMMMIDTKPKWLSEIFYSLQ